MLKPNLLNCYCGYNPLIKKRPIVEGSKVSYKYIQCSNPKCETYTFATRELEFAEELWNAAIKRK